MLQKISGVLLVMVGTIILTLQVLAGESANAGYVFVGVVLTVFGAVSTVVGEIE